MVVLFKALQVILALSLLIIIHEAGHYFWARIFGIKVEKFFLFFDVGGVKLFSFKKGDTEYGVGWLPLGGYCKIAGMIDESLDKDFLSHEPQPWEFRSKPAWKRLLVMNGGVLNNFILAILVFSLILGIWGKDYIPADRPVYASELAQEMGFRTGDRILGFDGHPSADFFSLQADLARRQTRRATVLRGSDTLDIYIDQSLIGRVLNDPSMFSLAVPFVVDTTMAGSPNGFLRRGDHIVGADGTPTPYLQDVQKVLRAHPGESVPVTVVRGSDSLEMALQVDSTGMVGVYLSGIDYQHKSYSGLACIPAGAAMAWENVTGYLKDLRLVATPSTGAYKSVGSFIAIGQIFPSAWDWNQFLVILAMLSIMLAVLNLLPIPGLDGGHMVFCLFEMITGKKPSDKFMIVMQTIGMVLLIGLMLLAFGNDFARLFGLL
ncbi:MAG: RIP metalloprotease RseP [Bacteroidales bacterium]|nr:RIP metalloprotease RseP [Bacteroidales bacterium]MBP5676076.1 RIP metalloprotease RseP [Bacteroidales bacterium]